MFLLFKLLFFMFFVFPLLVMILGAYAVVKLRNQLFKPFPKTPPFRDFRAPPQGDSGNVIEGEYTVVEEKDRI